MNLFNPGIGILTINLVIMCIASIMITYVVVRLRKNLYLWMIAYYFHNFGSFLQWLYVLFPNSFYDELNIIASGIGVLLIVATWIREYLRLTHKFFTDNIQVGLQDQHILNLMIFNPIIILGLNRIIGNYLAIILDSITEIIVLLLLSVALFLLYKIYKLLKTPSYLFFFFTLIIAVLNVFFTLLLDYDIPNIREIVLSFDLILNLFLLIVPLVILLEEKILEKQQELDILHENLRHAQKIEDFGKLTAGIAHDFNNLLMGISGNIELARMESTDNPTITNYLDEMGEISTSAQFLIKKLLAINRKSIVEPTLFKPNEEISNFTKILRRIIGENYRIKLLLDKQSKEIFFDISSFQQLLLNLIVNARDAMKKGGLITISTEFLNIEQNFIKPDENATQGEFLKLSVEDTGIGIRKEEIKKIFEPFYTTKGLDKGTGLGLSVVSSIIEDAHGFIRVYSEINKGSVFQIYLPIGQKQKQKVIMEKIEDFPAHDTGIICIIEDEESILKVMSLFLQNRGFTVYVFSNAKDFLKWFHYFDFKAEIRLIILDMVLPDKSGIELATKIERMQLKIPLLFTSGYSKYHLALQQEMPKDYPLIQKPFSLTMLLKKIYSFSTFQC